VALPAVYNYDPIAAQVENAVMEKFGSDMADISVIFPNYETETFLRNIVEDVYAVVIVPFIYDGGETDITFGVGGEMLLALEYKKPVFLYKNGILYALNGEMPFLSREETRKIETEFIEERKRERRKVFNPFS